MESTLRKHIVLSKSVNEFLENYQASHNLPNFSATIEAAAKALKQQSLIAGYEQFAKDYAASEAMQREAETWLGQPMEENLPAKAITKRPSPKRGKGGKR